MHFHIDFFSLMTNNDLAFLCWSNWQCITKFYKAVCLRYSTCQIMNCQFSSIKHIRIWSQQFTSGRILNYILKAKYKINQLVFYSEWQHVYIFTAYIRLLVHSFHSKVNLYVMKQFLSAFSFLSFNLKVKQNLFLSKFSKSRNKFQPKT